MTYIKNGRQDRLLWYYYYCKMTLLTFQYWHISAWINIHYLRDYYLFFMLAAEPLWFNFPDFRRGARSFCWKVPSPFLNCQPAGIPAAPTPKAQHCWLTHAASLWNMQQIVVDSGMMALGHSGTIRWWPGMITWLSGLRWGIKVPVVFGGHGFGSSKNQLPQTFENPESDHARTAMRLRPVNDDTCAVCRSGISFT